jgi:CheY-like chemotaxis protein
MSTTIESRRRVLFIDDDPAFLEMIRRVSTELSRGAWEVLVADSAALALGILGEQTVHLAVLDVEMPVLDGAQFLGLLNRRHPQLIKAVLTGYATESIRAACLANGAELFLEKPRTRSGQESLVAALNELLKIRAEEGFQGVLRRVGLVDLIQLECLNRHSCVLLVKGRWRAGEIYIRDGAIIHAVCGDRTGQKAMNRLLRLERGEFRLKSFSAPSEESIAGSWESILMEAMQVRDETRHLGEGDTLVIKAPEPVTSGPDRAESVDRPHAG